MTRARATYPSRQAALPPGASLVLVSDPLMEARDCSGAMLDIEGFTAGACRAARAPTATGIAEALVSDFNQCVCHSPIDDLTVVCVRR
jgi:serine phosphatase RsbU (regulator of sigma subunit)